jgi:hypothetical protein
MNEDLKLRLNNAAYEAIDLIEDLQRENARLDAGWRDANKEIVRVALIAKEAEAKLTKAVQFIQEVRRNGDTRLASMAIATLVKLGELEGKP